MKNLRLLLAFAVVLTLLASCKKSDPTYTSILTSHKWAITAATATFSDSTVTHNLITTPTGCTSSSYTEFHDYTSNNPIRLAYTYTTSTCTGYTNPSIDISAWDIDKDNANLFLNGSVSNGTNNVSGGQWWTITTLNGSTIVLTYVHQRQIGSTGYPDYNPIYDQVTETTTYTAK